MFRFNSFVLQQLTRFLICSVVIAEITCSSCMHLTPMDVGLHVYQADWNTKVIAEGKMVIGLGFYHSDITGSGFEK